MLLQSLHVPRGNPISLFFCSLAVVIPGENDGGHGRAVPARDQRLGRRQRRGDASQPRRGDEQGREAQGAPGVCL